jgi:hypothetical protein
VQRRAKEGVAGGGSNHARRLEGSDKQSGRRNTSVNSNHVGSTRVSKKPKTLIKGDETRAVKKIFQGEQQILRLGIELQVLSGVGSTDTDRKKTTLPLLQESQKKL